MKIKRIKQKSDYRIVIETEASGKKWYYVQKRCLFFFWGYLREVRDVTMYKYRVGWPSIEEAETQIFSDMNTVYINNQNKIIKREYINYGTK